MKRLLHFFLLFFTCLGLSFIPMLLSTLALPHSRAENVVSVKFNSLLLFFCLYFFASLGLSIFYSKKQQSLFLLITYVVFLLLTSGLGFLYNYYSYNPFPWNNKSGPCFQRDGSDPPQMASLLATRSGSVVAVHENRVAATWENPGNPIDYREYFILTEEGLCYCGRTNSEGLSQIISTRYGENVVVYWGDEARLWWQAVGYEKGTPIPLRGGEQAVEILKSKSDA